MVMLLLLLFSRLPVVCIGHECDASHAHSLGSRGQGRPSKHSQSALGAVHKPRKQTIHESVEYFNHGQQH